jgi:predicted transcriptional regulator
MTDTNPGDLVEVQETAPATLEFLVGSWNRFEVLNALATTPRTRDELGELTGVSRPTLSRILSDLTDREWIRRRNDEFEATSKGRVIASEVDQVVDNIQAAERLDTALEWIRTDLLGFDLAHLADAEILTPSPRDHTRPMRQLATYIDETEEMRIAATGVTYEVVNAICQAGVAGELRLWCVLDDHALGGIRLNPDLAAMFSEMIELGHCEAYHYLGEDDLLDYNLVDDAVMFCGISDDGLPLGILLSKNEACRTWTGLHFETLVDDSTLLDPDAVTP